MRLVYMGTPEFAVPSLVKLHENFTVVAVVTQPDKPKGRGNVLTPPPVKVKALELGLPLYQPLRVRDEAFLQEMERLQPDIILVAAYARLIPKRLLELPPLGCINLHPSRLPRYRGAIPVQAAIMNGDDTVGVTSFVMEEGYDTGPILICRQFPLGPKENGTELLQRLAQEGAEVLLDTVRGLEAGTLVPQPQEGAFEYTKPLLKADLFINWQASPQRVVNFIRALDEQPGASTWLNNQPLKVAKAEVYPQDLDSAPAGTVVALLKGRGPVVAVEGGAVVLTKLKPAGKAWMDGASFVAGRRLQIGDILALR